MARLNSQEEDLAAKLLFDMIVRGLKKELMNRTTHLIRVFSRTTTPPKLNEKVQIVLNIELPGSVLYSVEKKVKLP